MEPRIQAFDAPNPKGNGIHQMVYYEWGDPANAKVVVCVHGMTRNGRDFDYLARELSKNFRVICPDIVGRGRSDWFEEKDWYDNRNYAEDVYHLLQELNIGHCYWVGTSMGGILGMLLCYKHPTMIRKLVLNDIGAVIPKAGFDRLASYVGLKTHFKDRKEYEETMVPYFKEFGITATEHLDHALDFSAKRNEDGSYDLLYDPAIGNAFRTPDGKPKPMNDMILWNLWDMVHCPVMILRGENSDILTRDTANMMVEKHDDAKLVEVSGVGHAPGLMDSRQVELVATWLSVPVHTPVFLRCKVLTWLYRIYRKIKKN